MSVPLLSETLNCAYMIIIHFEKSQNIAQVIMGYILIVYLSNDTRSTYNTSHPGLDSHVI